jgi:rod shape-determining protein MreD
MKNGWGFWVLIGALVVLHFGLHLSVGLGGWAPDLLTLAVLLAARELPAGLAAGVGFVLGLLEDAVSLGAFAGAAITQTIVGFLGARSRDVFIGESGLFLALYLFVGAWIQDALYFVVAPSVRRGDAVSALLVHGPIEAFYLAVVGIVAMAVYRAAGR